ncbi:MULTISPECIES: HAD hydrolase-like protein [unclassified Lentimicrobium]|uniref:HAD hydrolase-like protein n=1 Tax=unclassified Lentimicrobium TaxID=2677434 RepID=UPI0015566AE7|nr:MULTISPECIES: HAD hydrolase-like protein [unclassified Lentimicrobium]NPD47824.1 HAD hydrolase-like protein [Lentimicrobium sp. S6]NPD86695.1 HAD hydrolase-like protein [Lentimicrobium sp. L6]
MININDFQAVLFDLDGTIIDPKEGIINSILYAAQEFGKEEKHPESLDSFIGPPLQHSFKNRYNLFDEEAMEMVRLYRVYYAKQGIYQCHLYDGIEEVIKGLFERGVFMALATSKPTKYADQLMRHFNLESYFDFTAGANLDGSRTDKIEVIQYALDQIPPFEEESILMLGDREFDIEGGNFHGLKTAYARWGYGDDKVVLKCKPDYILDKPLDLIVNC